MLVEVKEQLGRSCFSFLFVVGDLKEIEFKPRSVFTPTTKCKCFLLSYAAFSSFHMKKKIAYLLAFFSFETRSYYVVRLAFELGTFL